MNACERNAIAARVGEVSNLLRLTINLRPEVSFVDSNGHRNLQMDQRNSR